MQRRIIWKKWIDPFVPESEEDGDEDEPYKDSFQERESKKKSTGPLLVGPMGIIPINEHNTPSKVFNFWIGHTNFDITKSEADFLNTAEGVESLDVFTRYRFRIGIGKAFQTRNVIEHINDTLCGPKKKKKKVNDGLLTIKNYLRSKYSYWAICILPTGELETTGDNQKQNVQEKVQEYKSVDGCQVIASWEE